ATGHIGRSARGAAATRLAHAGSASAPARVAAVGDSPRPGRKRAAHWCFRPAGRAGESGWEKMCNWGCIVGGSGVSSRTASRGGGAPPTPPPRLGKQAGELSSGSFSRHVRPYARRQEPPDRAGPLPDGAVGRRGARDARGPQAVRGRVAARRVRALLPARARRTAAAVTEAERARTLLLRGLARR